MNRTKVFQFNLELFKVTGIQRVLLDIHEALKDNFDTKIVGNIPYDKVNGNLGISEGDYIRLWNPFMFRNSVVIIHERRLLPFMWLLTHIPGLNIKCVYVHHNEFYNNKRLSLFPKNIVAISDAGIKNLTGYFGVPLANITKIHNCVRETTPYIPRIKHFDSNDITILYPARINDVKRQIEIVNQLYGKIKAGIKILFAGIGPLYEEFVDCCKDKPQFEALGFRDDILQSMKKTDFVMLFSKHEGLPITLIEATMSGLPIICNDVGGNCEIACNGKNAIVVNDWESLISTLNSISKLDADELEKMSKSSRMVYESKFTFSVFKKRYTEFIKSIM